MQSRTSLVAATACGLACVMLLCYREEPSVQQPLKLMTVRDDNPVAPAHVFERLQEMEREIAVLKRKSWSEHLDPQVSIIHTLPLQSDRQCYVIRERSWQVRH